MILRVRDFEIHPSDQGDEVSIIQGIYDQHGGDTITLTVEQIPMFVEMLTMVRDELLKTKV